MPEVTTVINSHCVICITRDFRELTSFILKWKNNASRDESQHRKKKNANETWKSVLQKKKNQGKCEKLWGYITGCRIYKRMLAIHYYLDWDCKLSSQSSNPYLILLARPCGPKLCLISTSLIRVKDSIWAWALGVQLKVSLTQSVFHFMGHFCSWC